MSLERFASRLPPIDMASITKRGAYSEEAVAVQSIMSDNGWAEYRSALGFDPTQIGASILDIGVGQNARFVREARKKGYHVVGIAPFLTQDGKPQDLRTVRRHKTEGTIVQALASALPFADESFDTCVSLYTLSYIGPYLMSESASQLYPEAIRVLKPGGRAYIGRYTKKEYELAKPIFENLKEQRVSVRTSLSHKWVDRYRYEPRYSVTLQKPTR